MTRAQLEELAKRLESLAQNDYMIDGKYLPNGEWLIADAAVLRSLLAQEPVAWMHYYRKPGKGYSCADIGEHGPDPDEGFVHVSKEPLYASPVPAVDPEWKTEAMRLADEYADQLGVGMTRGHLASEAIDSARAALAAHLDLIGGK